MDKKDQDNEQSSEEKNILNKNSQDELYSEPSTSYQKNDRNQRSRSRTPVQKNQEWKSTNPFINFMQDFRQKFSKTKNVNMFRLAGEQWRIMSEEEKKPYKDAAKAIKFEKNTKKIKKAHKSINTVISKDLLEPKYQKQQEDSKSLNEESDHSTNSNGKESDAAATDTSENDSDTDND